MRSLIEKLWQSFFLGPAHIHWLAIDDLRNVRTLIVHVADQNRLCWTDDDARGLKTNIDAMSTEVTFLSRMIFGIDEDRIVRASGHAGFAADADRFVEIDYAVRPLEHRRRRTRGHARRVRALIAARHLVRAPHLRPDADIDVLDVSSRDTDGHDVFRFAGRGARMTADAAGVVNHLRPLHVTVASWLLLDHG